VTNREQEIDFGTGLGSARQPVPDPFANAQSKALQAPAAAVDPFARKPAVPDPFARKPAVPDPFAPKPEVPDPFARKPLGSKFTELLDPKWTNPVPVVLSDPFSKPPLSKPAQRLLSPSKLTAPSFTDEIDDEDLLAEEQAFLARMKNGGTPPGPPPPLNAPAVLSAAPAPGVAPAAKAPPVTSRPSFVSDVDDLSDEELL